MTTTISLHEEFAAAMAPFRPGRGDLRDLCIATGIGPLELMLYDSDAAGPWIAAVFIDVDRAREHFGARPGDHSTRLNPYSGKWNWHCHEFAPRARRHSRAERQDAGRKMIAAFVRDVQKTLP